MPLMGSLVDQVWQGKRTCELQDIPGETQKTGNQKTK